MVQAKKTLRFVRFMEEIGSQISLPEDSPQVVLQKTTLVIISITTALAGLVWAGMYYFLEYYGPALIPMFYSLCVGTCVVFCLVTKRYLIFQQVQLLLIFALPFAVHFALGGLVASGGVIIWGFVAPLGAALFSSRRNARLWFAFYVLVVLLVSFIEGDLSQDALVQSEAIRTAFFVMNILGMTGVMSIGATFFLSQIEFQYGESEILLEKSNRWQSQLESNINHRIEASQVFLEHMVAVSALNALAQKFTATVSEKELLNATALAVGKILDVDVAFVGLLEVSRPGLVHYLMDMDDGAQMIGYRPMEPASLQAAVIEQGQSLWSGKVAFDADPRWRKLAKKNVKSMMLLPINASSAPLGVITLMSYSNEHFSQRIRPLAEQLGTLLGTSLALRRATAVLRNSLEASDSLLANMFPAPVAGRMKEGERNIADRINCAGVFFCDLAGFTSYASKAPPESTLKLLQRYFDDIEDLCAEYHIEKIKTIGDAFMAVSGVSIETQEPIVQLADFSLAVARKLKVLVLDLEVPLGFRIGIHAGPLIAGVIGETRTSFDVWGDTVNMASRLESHAGIGEVACSQSVYEALGDRYAFEARAPVEMKGKGEQPLWCLKGKAPSS